MIRGIKRAATLGALAIAALGLAPAERALAADNVVMNLGWATPLESDYGILASKFEELA